MSSKTRNIFFIIGIVAVVLMILTFDVSLAQLWQQLCSAGYWLVPIIGMWLVLYLMNAWSWRIIIKGSGPCNVSFWRLFKITVSAFALNYATPVGLLGGEPYKIMELKPYIGVQRASSSVLLFAMMFIFAHFWYWVTAIVLYLIFVPLTPVMGILLGIITLFAMTGIYFFVKGYKNGMVRKLFRFLSRIPGLKKWSLRFVQEHEEDIIKIDTQISDLHKQNKHSFYLSFILEYIGRLLQSFEIFFMLQIFSGSSFINLHSPFMIFIYSILILAFTSLFANILFFLPLQLGGREGGFAMSVAKLGMTAQVALSVSIICRVRELVWTAIGLLLIKVGNKNYLPKAACLLLLAFGSAAPSFAQNSSSADHHCDIFGGVDFKDSLTLEVSGTASSGDYAPLWLSSGKYGLSSVESNSAYERVAFGVDADFSKVKDLSMRLGLDFALMQNGVSDLIVQQAFLEAQYKKVRLIIGAKEYPIDLRNGELTSGGLSAGNNARPIPQIRGEVDYCNLPWTNKWVQWKARLSYGLTTDGSWQSSVVNYPNHYTSNTLYHEKALSLRFGKKEVFPLTYEIGIQMMSQFGGTSYNVKGRGISDYTTIHHKGGLAGCWDALFCRGGDATDGVDRNTAGNHLGSYIMALNYYGGQWQAKAYFERYFEDQSMLTVQYGIYDHLIGLEVQFPKNRFVDTAVLEHLSTTNQSGAVYHDATATMPEKMNGRDSYYNHNLYSGWQHWGYGIGHPFLTSPVYFKTEAWDNTGKLLFNNTRVQAWHLAFSGTPFSELHYRVIMSFTRNWGDYNHPIAEIVNQNYFLLETTYRPHWAKQWAGRLSLGLDHGHLLGNSFGAALTVSKKFNL